jgi:hypothetical protein
MIVGSQFCSLWSSAILVYPMPFVFDSVVKELVKLIPSIGGDERDWMLVVMVGLK